MLSTPSPALPQFVAANESSTIDAMPAAPENMTTKDTDTPTAARAEANAVLAAVPALMQVALLCLLHWLLHWLHAGRVATCA